MLKINPLLVVSTTEALQKIGIPYGWGRKVNTSFSFSQFVRFCTIHGIDCSGFVDWLVKFASEESIEFPEGSIAIGEHLHQLALKGVVEACHYSETSRSDNKLRICGFNLGGEERHVFFMYNGFSCESHGHSIGVSRRPWNHPSLLPHAQWCYVVSELNTAPAKAVEPADLNTTKVIDVSELQKANPSQILLPKGMNLDIVLENPSGSLRGNIKNIAGLTKDGHSVIYVKELPRIFGNFEVRFEQPNMLFIREVISTDQKEKV